MEESPIELSSAGHKLGQRIGDWFERYFVLPLLQTVAQELALFLDNRYVSRTCRGGKIEWPDADDNLVDFDFVLELDGDKDTRGIPVAFVESFWRRGSRHSKDKARDDTGKLTPLRDAYPTARFLGLVAAGEFTKPAVDLVRSRDVDLFYIPKDKLVRAFAAHGLTVDYPDRLNETDKRRLVESFEARLSEIDPAEVATTLRELIGVTAVESYASTVLARLRATPQEVRFSLRHQSSPQVFSTIVEATAFLESPHFNMDSPAESYLYEVMYSDGTSSEREVCTLDQLTEIHHQVHRLTEHISQIYRQ